MTKTQIRVIFTDKCHPCFFGGLLSPTLWDIYLINNVYPYLIRVFGIYYWDDDNEWKVCSEGMIDEMDERNILDAPIFFKKMLQNIIEQSNK